MSFPILTPETGPFQGISDNKRASEPANMAMLAGSVFPSNESNVIVTFTSLLILLLKSGLNVLSTSLAVKTDSSDGLPSLLVNLEPNISPPA